LDVFCGNLCGIIFGVGQISKVLEREGQRMVSANG
jgi:hypothetical protein